MGISLYERGVNMTYVPPVYPTTIPTAGDLPDRVDDVDWLFAARYNELKKELRAALTELGTTPKGASADVAARLATLAPKASPVFTGQATIPTINLTGGQIAFPAVAVPSADPNTMDDYERGTWTAAFTAGGGTITIGTSYNTGKYIKIGDLIHVEGYFYVASVSIPTGAFSITGLPFIALGGDQQSGYSACAVRWSGLANNMSAPLSAAIAPGGAIISIAKIVNGSQAQLAGDIQAGVDIAISLTYRTV